ncbi:DUF3618 domain-containing protein [Actinoplanes regularis]|uniref:DUF3618 domain-containing protein n=1 Tax=Actinoplanes regularis TaxID=52697 RepID=A0A239EHV9_9ACTN|nr:DUF3618 domain-containing protein [Actinoplanes regularis]GIE89121.1 hypothetical protein Are01nite_56010 [Actinoplanes regularis]GLW34782.1 hypothetical protein Areg01_77190 [Actinoplanes regularis]SNS44235.1 Protein of unknown function [Actinoplanes regularis]
MSEIISERNGTAKPDLVALRAEIKQTRAELGETVQALAARADVKARAREQVSQTKQRLLDQAALATGRLRDATSSAKDTSGDLAHGAVARVRSNQLPAALIVAGLAAVVGAILIMRGRR